MNAAPTYICQQAIISTSRRRQVLYRYWGIKTPIWIQKLPIAGPSGLRLD
jgi:hypothetical protein